MPVADLITAKDLAIADDIVIFKILVTVEYILIAEDLVVAEDPVIVEDLDGYWSSSIQSVVWSVHFLTWHGQSSECATSRGCRRSSVC